MKLRVDRKIYSDECISKLVYELSSEFSFKRKLTGEMEEIDITSKDQNVFDENQFWDMINDFKLRTIISNETKDIRTILFAKAFGDFDELTEDDLQE